MEQKVVEKPDRTEGLQEILEGIQAFKRGMVAIHRKRSGEARALTTTQWVVLETVARQGSISIKDLKDALCVSSSAATQTVNGLVKDGYVVRTTMKNDRRVTTIALAPKAVRMRSQIRRRMLARLEQAFAVLSDAEFAMYRRLHTKLIRALIS